MGTTTARSSSRDYSGVPTAQLAAVFETYATVDVGTLALRIGMSESDVKDIVISQDYPFTGLGKADKICLGLGLNVTWLERSGEITIVPAHERWKSAEKMAKDEALLALENGLPAPTPEELERRVEELNALRVSLVIETDAQRTRLDRDAARTRKRLAKTTTAPVADTA